MTNFLTGKTINAIKIADDKKALLFVCADGEHIARAYGDCCSDTWIESVSAPAMGFPCLVFKAEDLEMPDSARDDENHEVIAFYGLKLTTDKGEIIIDYRNSSNGYYGGNLAWPGDYFDGGVYGQNKSTLAWREVEFA